MTLTCEWCGSPFEDTHCRDVTSRRVLDESRDDLPTICRDCNDGAKSFNPHRTIVLREVRAA